MYYISQNAMCSVNSCSEVQTCFPILPHTLHHRHSLLYRGNTHANKNLTNTPLFLAHCYLLAALRCTAVQPSKGNCLEKPVTLRQTNWSSSCSTCRHSQPLPSALSTAFMCMVMLRAYCWLSLLPILPFISCSLVKGL